MVISGPVAARYQVSSAASRHGYRPDIDGLRAIAVLSVLMNHLNAAYLPGGFVGVDIFFVISGFVITKTIRAEITQGRFSFWQFYKRRINRIFPALILVLLSTSVLGLLLLSPHDLSKLAKSNIYATLSLSNIYFWQEYGNYFSSNAEEAPLLHTWSLAVEEQFYLAWPIAVIFLARPKVKNAVFLLTFFTISGGILSEYATHYFASASYYLIPTRFFELTIGSLLAYPVFHHVLRLPYIANVGGILGYALITGSLLLLNGSSPFPGVNAVFPCAGAALLILAGSDSLSVSRILSAKPLVRIGLISYSLYLWHWPIIAYLNYLNIEITPLVAGFVIITAVSLAWLSWKYVEIPMRVSGNTLEFSHVFSRRFVIPSALTIGVSFLFIYFEGLPGRFDHRVLELEEAVQTEPNKIRYLCHVPTALYKTPLNPNCTLGVEKPAPDGLLIGDSFANHFSGLVDVLAKTSNIQLQDYTMSGCPPILGYATGKGQAYEEACKERNRAIYEDIQNRHYRLIVMAASWPDDEKAGDQLEASIKTIQSSGAKVTVILSNESISHAESCTVRNKMYGMNRDCTGKRRGQPSYFAGISKRHPSPQIIDPNVAICDSDRCSPVLENTVLYRDTNHLNDLGSRLIGRYLLAHGVRLQSID